ncbi:hypothetical protein ACQ4M3_29475 [Leptolyngbya sp. AN03gr2]|uniref:hypothetical protein n=1 Tax=unclassified Leptolyngbya TaxID=2650499 RepID=UPI003D31932E
MKRLANYLYNIRPSKAILWCYLIWYLVTVYFYFDPSPKIWANSIGISAVVGTALLLSVSAQGRDFWQVFRLYLMPFCVSSFSALIKEQGFFVVISPRIQETIVAVALCGLFLGTIAFVKATRKP